MKKLLSLALALVMLLTLSVSAFAAEAPHDVDLNKEPLAFWNEGPSLVIQTEHILQNP